MLQVMVRPESELKVVEALEKEGVYAMTKWDVLGRGQQHGIQVGEMHYSELPKVMMLVVVEDDQLGGALNAVKQAAYTGHYGDGRVFVSPVSHTYTIRTGKMTH